MDNKNYAVFRKRNEWVQESHWVTLEDARHHKALSETCSDAVFCILMKVEDCIKPKIRSLTTAST
jgi:hypothetical protein